MTMFSKRPTPQGYAPAATSSEFEQETKPAKRASNVDFTDAVDLLAPRPVRRDAISIFFSILLDVILFLCSTAFMVFGFIVRAYDGSPVEDNEHLTNTLESAAIYAPTIFPILFAFVGSRAIRAVMQWRLTKGVRIGTLDLLASSSTVGGAAMAQISLWSFSILGLFLIIVWALSPVGSQASLRVVGKGNETTTIPTTFDYVLPNSSFTQYESGDQPFGSSLLNSVFLGTLISSDEQRLATVDPWNNVKIPMIESVEKSGHSDAAGWFEAGDGINYASLLGVPISPSSNSTSRNSSLAIQTSYWTLDCSKLSNQTSWVMNEVPITYDNASALSEVGKPWQGAMNEGQDLLASNFTPPSYQSNASCSRQPHADNLPPRTIFFRSNDQNGEGLEDGSRSGGLCNVRTTYVEAQIECNGPICATTKIRRSLSPYSVPEWTLLDADDCQVFSFFAHLFINSIDSGHALTPTPLGVYLVNPSNPLSSQIFPPAAELPAETYEIRLAQLLNTYWAAATRLFSVPQGINNLTTVRTADPLEINAGAAATSSSDYQVYYRSLITSTNGQQTSHTLVIRCNNGWLAALTLASAVLMIACMATPLVRFWSNTPDLLLNYSSLLRDNHFVSGSEIGSSLDAADRARLLSDTVIRFGDVTSDGNIGHLSFASVDRESPVGSVDINRLYA